MHEHTSQPANVVRTNRTLRTRFPGVLTDSERPVIDVYDGESVSTRELTTPVTLSLLSFATEPRTLAEIDEHLRERSSLDADRRTALTASLRDDGILVAPGATPESAVEWVRRGWYGALYYHLQTRDDGPADGSAFDYPPTAAESPPGPRVALPDPEPLPDVPFADVLLSRRTCRDFDGTAISRQSLSTLLFHTFEPIRRVRSGDVEAATTDERLAVAGLAPFLVVNRGSDLDTGVYRYDPANHALFEVEGTALADDADGTAADAAVQRLVTGQPYIDGASMTLVLTFRIAHLQQSGNLSCLRNLFTTASASGHRLLLTAVGTGFEVFQTAAVSESVASELLGVDEFAHAPGYVLAVGQGEVDA
ncbi:nitroreductase family protein [Halorussus caseinilyticus]|uniref:nitroreductase family protein n=1 Tax=Halorussus caseinilyticus TaxID=3034025 RepID=UPI0023E8D932|nr:nitroreductase family protein [Halorussus sp. DT72]